MKKKKNICQINHVFPTHAFLVVLLPVNQRPKNLTVGWFLTSGLLLGMYSNILAVLLFIFRLQLVVGWKVLPHYCLGKESIRGSATKPLWAWRIMQFPEPTLLQLLCSLRWESKGKVKPFASSACQTVHKHLKEWKPCEVEPFMPWYEVIIVTGNTIFWVHRITELAEWTQVHSVVFAF